jgi:hypothetical protein
MLGASGVFDAPLPLAPEIIAGNKPDVAKSVLDAAKPLCTAHFVGHLTACKRGQDGKACETQQEAAYKQLPVHLRQGTQAEGCHDPCLRPCSVQVAAVQAAAAAAAPMCGRPPPSQGLHKVLLFFFLCSFCVVEQCLEHCVSPVCRGRVPRPAVRLHSQENTVAERCRHALTIFLLSSFGYLVWTRHAPNTFARQEGNTALTRLSHTVKHIANALPRECAPSPHISRKRFPFPACVCSPFGIVV